MSSEITRADACFSGSILDFHWRITRKAIFGLIRESGFEEVEKEEKGANSFVLEASGEATHNKQIYALNNPRFDQNNQLDPWLADFLPAYVIQSDDASLISRSSNKPSLYKNMTELPRSNLWKISVAVLFSAAQLGFNLAIFLVLFRFKKIPKKGLFKNIVFSTFTFFRDFFNYFGLFFQIRNSILVVTDAYSKPGIVSCARFFSIYVIELQHGLITKNLPHYHFPHHKLKSTMPNEILLFSEKWKDASRFPRGQRIGFYDAKRFSQFSGIDVSSEQHNPTLVFLMQKSDKQILLDDLGSVCMKAPTHGIRVILRLHPRQSLEDFQYLKGSMKSLEIVTADSTLKIGHKTAFVVGNSFSAFQLVSAGFMVCIKDAFLEKHYFFADNREAFVEYTSVDRLLEKVNIFSSNLDVSSENHDNRFFDGNLSQPRVLSV